MTLTFKHRRLGAAHLRALSELRAQRYRLDDLGADCDVLAALDVAAEALTMSLARLGDEKVVIEPCWSSPTVGDA